MPRAHTFAELWRSSGLGLLTYLLSFVCAGIHGNNRPHLAQIWAQIWERVNGVVLWANLVLLCMLSLLPFTTSWMDFADA